MNIVLIILGIYVLVSPFLMISCVKLGYEMGQVEPVTVNKIKRRHKKVKLSAEEQKALDILNNVDVYDGTSRGQREIKSV